jgi:hypothetical protein
MCSGVKRDEIIYPACRSKPSNQRIDGSCIYEQWAVCSVVKGKHCETEQCVQSEWDTFVCLQYGLYTCDCSYISLCTNIIL